jgi:hypothetical protein
MSYFSDLHLELLARGVLQRGETLHGKAVTTHAPWWALGFLQRTYVLLATPWRLVLLEHRRGWFRRSLELASVNSIPWRDVKELKLKGLFSTKLRFRAHVQKRPIAMTMKVPSWLAPMRRNVDGARRVADAFLGARGRPSAPALPAAGPGAVASRPPTLRLVPSPPSALGTLDPDRTLTFRRKGTSLEGTWRLLAVEARSEGRTISTPFGRYPIGQLVYMADGRMSVMLMAAARPKFGSHGIRAGTGPEKAAAFDSFLAYSGRYERLEDRVIHHPDVASIPDFVGVPEERFVSLEGDRLILSTPPMLEDGQFRTFVIVWQRVSVPGRTALSLVGPNDNASEDADATTKMRRAR